MRGWRRHDEVGLIRARLAHNWLTSVGYYLRIIIRSEICIHPFFLLKLRSTFSAAEIETEIEATATAATTGCDATEDETTLEAFVVEKKVSRDFVFAKLLSDVETERAVLVVDLPLCWVAQNRVCVVHFLKLFCGFWTIWILIRMVLQSKFAIRSLDVFCS